MRPPLRPHTIQMHRCINQRTGNEKYRQPRGETTARHFMLPADSAILTAHRWVSLYPLPVVPHFGKAPRRQAATVSSWTWNTSPSAGFSHCSEGGLILRDPSELNPLKCPPGFCLHVQLKFAAFIERRFREHRNAPGLTGTPRLLQRGEYTHFTSAHTHLVTHTHWTTPSHTNTYIQTPTHTHVILSAQGTHTYPPPTHTHTLQHNKCLMIALIWFGTEWDTTQTNMADNSIIRDPAGKFKHFGKKQIGVRAPFISI